MKVAHGIRGISCVLLLCCATAQAQSDESTPPRLEIETVPQWDGSRRDTPPAWKNMDGAALSSQRLVPGLSANPSFGDDGLRARWWWGRGAIEVGAGADWRAPSFTTDNAAQNWSQVVGVRAQLSARTRVVYETHATLPWRSGDSGATNARASRVALEFKSRKSAVSNLRDGLLRMQLSSDAAVHFKPRGGGLQVTYRERF